MFDYFCGKKSPTERSALIFMFFLGVDGGGTKTEFLLMNEEGQRISSTTLGTLDWFQIGAQGMEETLGRGISYVCREGGISRSDLDYSMLGIPCLGDELIDEEPIVREIVSRLLPNGRCSLVNDAEIGWAGSLACRPGIHLVSGTGAIGYGVNSSGRTARASGWGHEVGDEGSAYWLGMRLLYTFSREADGREQRSLIYDMVRNHFGITDDFHLLKILQHEWQWNREKIAGLARLLHQAAEAGEPKAVECTRQIRVMPIASRRLWLPRIPRRKACRD
jgi:N-acetylglucosamine kinase-like BadF-type ATPase